MNKLKRGLIQIVSTVEKNGLSYALVGGLAVAVHGRVRFTDDIDLAVAVQNDKEAEALLISLREEDYEIKKVIEHIPSGRMATAMMSREEIGFDLLFASSGIENEIVESSRPIELTKGVHVSTISKGFLIACKILSADPATRSMDIEDLRWLVSRASPIDLGEAKKALDLITERGFNREKDLDHELNSYVSQSSSNKSFRKKD